MDFIVKKCVDDIRERLELSADNGKALLIYDMHKTNTRNPPFYHNMENTNCLFKLVPAGMTGELQPMDLYANNVIKVNLKEKFDNWYTNKALCWISNGEDIGDFQADLRWSIMKPIHARWLITTWHELPADIMTKSFESLNLCSWDDHVNIVEEQEEHKTD